MLTLACRIDGTFLDTLLFARDSDRFLDITIRLDQRPDAKLQLEVSADVERVRYDIRKSRERTVRRESTEKMYVYGSEGYIDADVCVSPCFKTNEVVIKLYEYRRKDESDKVEVCSRTVSLRNDELYMENTYTSEYTWCIMSCAKCLIGDNGRDKIIISFAYTRGGNN